jgi:hypothetical protein
MASIPSLQPHPQEEQLRNRVKQLETENRQLRAFFSWEDHLFSNPHFSPAQKLAFRQAEIEMEKGTPNDAGLTHLNITYISKKIGMSAKITGKNLQVIAEANGLTRQVETIITEVGEQQTRVYFAPTEQTARPHLIKPPQPRNHGGARKRCKDCGSENLVEQVTITCIDCGAEQHRTRRSVNTSEIETASHLDHQEPEPMDNLTSVLQPEKPMDNLTAGEEPTTPPMLDTQGTIQGQKDDIISLLLDIAGDIAEHIVMNDGTAPLFTDWQKKYKTIHTGLSERDIFAHLRGIKTVGGTLHHQDGTARALCFDTDNEAGLQLFRVAICKLHSTGVNPLLEISPAGRGGHLWIIFSERVNAQAAYRYVCEIAPELREIREYWPSAVNQKVRLPAGKYVTPTFAAWPLLINAAGAEIVKTDLLDYQTPADLVPEYQEPEPPQGVPEIGHRIAADPRKAESGIDPYWQQKYSQKTLWFAWTPAQLAAIYNERHTIADMLDIQKNGMAFSPSVAERTPSTAETPDGQAWVDFSSRTIQADGKHDGGDSFELYARRNGDPKHNKSMSMRQFSRELVQEAKAALEDAARGGVQPPAWLLPFITPAGWKHYSELGGVVGFLPEQHNTPEPGKETAAQPAPEPEAENHSPTWYTVGVKRDTTGIPVLCCQCRKPTVWYDGISGYCSTHWRQKKDRAGEPIFEV